MKNSIFFNIKWTYLFMRSPQESGTSHEPKTLVFSYRCTITIYSKDTCTLHWKKCFCQYSIWMLSKLIVECEEFHYNCRYSRILVMSDTSVHHEKRLDIFCIRRCLICLPAKAHWQSNRMDFQFNLSKLNYTIHNLRREEYETILLSWNNLVIIT